jgi:hypothetical protein
MDLKKELPKLGQVAGGKVYYEVDGESIHLGRRPNYAEFKSKPYQDEETCVSVLLGISKPNALLLSLVRRMNSLSIKDKGNDPAYRLYRQLVNLFQSIRETIDIGIETGDIGKVSETKENDMQVMFRLHSSAMSAEPDIEFTYNFLNCEFLSSRYFDTLGFLNWMQENGFPIPDELAIDKDRDGQSFWAGSRQPIDYSNLSDDEKAMYAWEWKKPGLNHKTNEEINVRLYPHLTSNAATKRINRMVLKFRK